MIAILPAITKLYEQLLHQRILTEMWEKAPLHEHQRGFVAGKSTQHNLHDIFNLIKGSQAKLRELRDRKIPPARRPNHYLLFIDLRKAFDTVNRKLLLERLEKKGFSGTLLAALRDFMQDMQLVVKDQTITTNIGVV